MKKKRQKEPELIQYRIRYHLESDVTPIEKYFMAPNAENALEMFAYSCREFEKMPSMQDFSEWNRWTEEWKLLSIPNSIPETSET